MKQFLLAIAISTTFFGVAFGQAPEGINYQAIARNASGLILTNQAMNVRLSIHEGSTTNPVYQEVFNVTTNQFGLFTLQIGTSTNVISGNFPAINWGLGAHYLQVEIDPGMTGTFADMGTTQLMSVPYALYAKQSANGPQGLASLTVITAEPAGSNCTNGGNKVETGLDANSNSILDPSEITNTSYVCNGTDGTNGIDGVNGTDGINGSNGQTSLVKTTAEAPGANCVNGGSRIESGLDVNGNSVLDGGEVTLTSYVCNGANGTNGSNGQTSLSKSTAEAPGVNCANGGSKIESGLDANANSVLDAGEVTSTTYVCNGANGSAGTNGFNSLLKSTPEAIGINCANGGKKIESGLDANSNNVLDAGEVTATFYVCNGLDGSINSWSLNGNTATVAGVNFIGTTDAVPLSFKVNNQNSGLIDYDPSKANTGFGFQSLNSLSSGVYNTSFGYQALFNNSFTNQNTAIGWDALYSNSLGNANTSVGGLSLFSNVSGNNNNAFGYTALYSNVGGYNGVAIGYNSQANVNDQASFWDNTNTSVGYQSLMGSFTPSNNTGNGNNAFGRDALFSNSTGYENTAIGWRTLYANTTGYHNAAAGSFAMYNNQDGSFNTVFGNLAGQGSGNYSFYNNSLFGYGSGYALTTGSNNTLLGFQAGSNLNSESNNILIGFNIDGPGGDNKLSIGNLIFGNGIDGTGSTLSSGNVGIGTSSPTQKLEIQNGNLLLSNTFSPHALILNEGAPNGSNFVSLQSPDALEMDVKLTLPPDLGMFGDFLATDGTGILSWKNISSMGGVSGSGSQDYVPKWNDFTGTMLGNSSIYDNGAFVGINQNYQLTGADYFDITTPTGFGSYGGMYINTADPNGLPFYGYALNGSASAWTYLDGVNNKWNLSYGGDRITVKNTGEVGIDNTNPVDKLDVAGSINASSGYKVGGSVGASGQFLRSDGFSGFVASTIQPGDLPSGAAAWSKAGSNVFTTSPSDNVGIGTNLPTVKLDVNGGSIRIADANNANLTAFSTGANSNSFLSLVAQGVSQKEWRLLNDGASNGVLKFYDASAGFDRMVINTGGNVGIGISTPLNKLDVNGGVVIGASNAGISTAPVNGLLVDGNIGVGGTSATYAVDVLQTGSAFFRTKSTTGYAGMIIDKGAATENGYLLYRTLGAEKWGVGTKGSDDYSIFNWPNSREDFKINNTNGNVSISNNLGVGVAPSASYQLFVQKDNSGTLAFFDNNSLGGGTGLSSQITTSATGAGTRYGLYSLAWNGQGTNYGTYSYGFGGTTAYGIYAIASGAATNYAGYFSGDVRVIGNLSATGTKPFVIDHPLDPENKYLYHFALESPDVLNMYTGNITTDGAGEATVQLPDYFSALNIDFRYQLTCIGAFAQAIVLEEVTAQNTFKIKTNQPNVKVSWQVVANRNDKALKDYFPGVEVEKPANERGKYLSPKAFGKPEEMGLDYLPKKEQMEKQKADELQKIQNDKTGKGNIIPVPVGYDPTGLKKK